MDIIIFATIAIIIFLKLKDQLGKISEEEKDLINKKRQATLVKLQEQIIKQIENVVENETQDKENNENIVKNLNDDLKQTLQKILDSCQISAQFFLDGAKSAFEMVIKAFAGKDLEMLETLLCDKIYNNFKKTIDERKKQDKTLNSEIISIENAEIISATIEGNEAFITVKFASKQINYFTNKDGEVIEGKKEQINELNDSWTFKKDLTSKNPNWKISATG